MSSSEQLQGTTQSDTGKLEAAVTSGIPSATSGLTVNGTTNEQSTIAIGASTTGITTSTVNVSNASVLNFGTGSGGISQDPLTYNNNPTHQTLGGIGVAGYSAFPSVATATADGSWTPTTFDPSLMGGFGFTGPNVLTAPNQFFFPASTDVWGQADPLMMNNNWLLSPVAMDQQQIPSGGINLGVGSTEASIPSTLEPVSSIEQTFNSLTLNGSMLPIGGGTSGSQLIGGGGTTAINSNTGSSGTPSAQVIPTVETTTAPTIPNEPPQDTKPKSWAAIASQPAKPKPPPPKPAPQPKEEPSKRQPSHSSGHQTRSNQGNTRGSGHQSGGHPPQSSSAVTSSGNHNSVNGNGPKRSTSKTDAGSPKKMIDVVSKLKSENSYNPSEMNLNLSNARYFVIKSYAEDDVHRSIKYNVWCSTEHGNRRLDMAFKEQRAKGGSVYLFFSVNGSGHFCGVAKMMSEVDLGNDTGIWTQDKWKGKFDIKWIYVKDVPNGQLRHIRLENNENKPVTNSRDTQEVPVDKGKMVMKVVHSFSHTTSIFDDFEHYEKRQEEEGVPTDNESASTPNTNPTTVTGSSNKKDRKS